MKLKDKKTGKPITVKLIQTDCECLAEHEVDTLYGEPITLETLSKYCEDYEEPKRGWFINDLGNVFEDYCLSEGMEEAQRSIGNYFETKEEAEKAVEKLKAWKRLRDKGFKFRGWCDRGVEPIGDMGFHMPKTGEEWTEDEIADLESLFGGEE